MKILLSEQLSYCFGVRQTLDLVEKLLARKDAGPFYMLGEIVHNEHVIAALKERGLRIVDRPDQVEPGGTVILRSHGSPRALLRELRERGIPFIDATCPMVEVIHRRIQEVEASGATPVVIGQAGHEEVRGIAGQVRRAVVVGRPEEVTPELFAGVERAGVVVQSTFVPRDAAAILERIRAVVPEVVFHDTVCRPTRTRQKEVEERSRAADRVVIVGSKRSANTMHLFRLARAANPETVLIDRPEAIEDIPIPPDATVFIASGASTPEALVLDVVRRLRERSAREAAP